MVSMTQRPGERLFLGSMFGDGLVSECFSSRRITGLQKSSKPGNQKIVLHVVALRDRPQTLSGRLRAFFAIFRSVLRRLWSLLVYVALEQNKISSKMAAESDRLMACGQSLRFVFLYIA